MLRLPEHTETETMSYPPPTSALLPVGLPQSDALPELRDGAGEVGGVAQAVVGEALLRVPGVVAALPRQLLRTATSDQRIEELSWIKSQAEEH